MGAGLDPPAPGVQSSAPWKRQLKISVFPLAEDQGFEDNVDTVYFGGYLLDLSL